MNGIPGQFSSIEQIQDQYLNAQRVNYSEQSSDISFAKVLQEKQQKITQPMDALKFSKHATMRLADRDISLSEEQSVRLEEGVKKASEKGIKESLVVMDSLAFIVNVPNRTVVTAIDQTESENNIFTNIDGAVIV
ncbi:MAG: TIGR02530 family flagellar biosynthesis protein [Roseburia sp.]